MLKFFLLTLVLGLSTAEQQTVLPPTLATSKLVTVPTTPIPPKILQEDENLLEGKIEPQQMYTNPAFDPQVYPNFLHQDAVAQYVAQYGQPAGAIGFIPSIESIIIPAAALESKKDVSDDGVFQGLGPIIATLAKITSKIGFTLLSITGVLVMGTIITSIFCTFTPFCRVSFLEVPLQSVRNSTVDVMDKFGTEITTDRIRRAAQFVTAAIDKYEQLQKISRVARAY